ncbi:uncharacterized protein N7484_002393 [Penicillium longicatenatum]|uniref:uncharacterized protein n=1 Tax=Penicillium longicatenatum TaxID=1561947 RepID=UPI002548CCEC|nr:uncharacterized protein N7484_002393 [Penicillium longicatenatum]KAJ5658744.1 hypothetical protein N7484_002393 [Penicillium longicatenatum]
MSDHQNISEAAVSAGPASNQPDTIDTPPVANATMDAEMSVASSATETPVQSSTSTPMTPMIPGLGLVNGPNDQSTEQPAQPTMPTTVDPELDVSVVKDATAEPSVTMEETTDAVKNGQIETLARQEQAEGAHEAMEVDQMPELSSTENANGTSEAQMGDAQEEGEEEHPEWEVDSSPYESSSDSSSDSDDSDDEDYPILTPEEQARILMMAEGGSDDEGDGKGKSGGYIRSTNEVAEDVLPIPDVTITPEMNIVYLGKVQAAIENAVLVEANTSGEYQVLESGSLLCSEDRKIMGVVSETLGRVEHPLYTVMFSTAAEVQERGLVKDMPIYYVESHSTFVFTQPLKGLKGSDASNFHDEEVAEDEMEFSDDEAEADYKRQLKQKRQERKDARDGGKPKRGPPGPSKLGQSELNYDEGGEEGYTPLARPKNLHEMMGTHEAPVEGSGSGFRGGRGRGRGTDRGRGGRGRGGAGRGGSREQDQDRRPQQPTGGSSYGQPAQAPQHQQASYGQPAYPQQQQPAFGMPQPFAGYQQFAQQYAQQYAAQQQQAPQGAPTQFPFQFPFAQAFPQPNPFQPGIPAQAHINPLFLAALQQQQQQQQYQQQQQQQQPQQYQQPQQAPAQGQQQNPAMNFDQVKAQLDILRNLNNGQQGPPPS